MSNQTATIPHELQAVLSHLNDPTKTVHCSEARNHTRFQITAARRFHADLQVQDIYGEWYTVNSYDSLLWSYKSTNKNLALDIAKGQETGR